MLISLTPHHPTPPPSSFVNGGSQNTICTGLLDLASNCSVYVLGTDFKAGQTKFKTCAVEYIRECGWTPQVVASCNHLGNNDIKNLDELPAAMKAKMEVKHDIFEPWEETQLDHKGERERERERGA
jgi:myo-inositol-1-phosphate synthase